MKAKKSLGQNFLIDKNIINKISDVINVTSKDLIIEIGPGKGALTKELQEKGAKLICYEIDTDMIPYLNKILNNNSKVIYKDILNSDIKEDIKNITYQNLYVVGNLPYYITTPIIKYIIETGLDIKEMVFMVQDEVADRFSAIPGNKEYSSITLYLNYYFQIKKLFKVTKKSFDPVPKVDSAILKFQKREDKPYVDKEKYFNFINECFKMKRKTLKNNLYNYDFEKINKVLKKYNLNETVRAEELEEKILIEIFNNIN